jgi:hypothetical protein
MNKAHQTSADMQLAAEAEMLAEPAYDPARARLAARRLKGARWRRLVLFFSAIVIAGAAAGGFTLANRDALLAAIPAPEPSAPPAVSAAAAPESAGPSLASANSRSVQLPGLVTPDSDPNKAQARVVMPADPEPPAAAPATPIQMQDSQPSGAPRAIPLGGRLAVTASSEAAPALPSGALGFAPVPAPRPSSAP